MKTARFNSVARIYRFVERMTFGNVLQEARVAWISEGGVGAQNVLILGEGDGRFLQAFRARHPEAMVTVVEASEAMAGLARTRAGDGVNFVVADARNVELEERKFDLIVTHFFLDCFTPDDAEQLVRKLSRAATANSRWLMADFELPASGWRRWHAGVWLGVMYAFFRLATGIEARSLPPSVALIEREGFVVAKRRTWRFDLLASMLFVRSRPHGEGPDTMRA